MNTARGSEAEKQSSCLINRLKNRAEPKNQH